MTTPLFADEGPSYYDAAYRHNSPFAKPGPYQAALNQEQEAAFRQWLHANRVEFDPNAKIVDYDMRGFWKDTGGAGTGREPDGSIGYPDNYKTPYDTTFSRESRYATANCPFAWKGDDLVDLRNGQLIFSRSPGPAPSTASAAPGHARGGSVGRASGCMGILHPNGGITPLPGGGTVRLQEGEELVLLTPTGVVRSGRVARRGGAIATIQHG
jgi:hypothetical protein